VIEMPEQSRRQFLQASAVGAGALLAPRVGAAPRAIVPTADSVIFLMLTGGPSQLDTWDPKPGAPSDVRSPFAPIRTKVPGLHVTELFPQMATIADKFALVRSVHHTDAPIHEIGFQWVNTGRLFRDGPVWPSVGAVVDHLLERKGGHFSIWFVWPNRAEVNTGLAVSKGQGTGWRELGAKDPCRLGPGFRTDVVFDYSCAVAARPDMTDVRFFTINHFTTVFDAPSWDCHAASGALRCSLNDYRDTVAPNFDTAFTQLVTDLDQRGLLERTLVIATGEFGRTPKLNCNGGRDHWPGVWTTIFAGGGVKGGQAIGSSDAIGSEPKDRPVHARDIPATIFRALGIGADATIPGPDGQPVWVYEGRPVTELF
jgi:Protein of unknown function (DUF1501)